MWYYLFGLLMLLFLATACVSAATSRDPETGDPGPSLQEQRRARQRDLGSDRGNALDWALELDALRRSGKGKEADQAFIRRIQREHDEGLADMGPVARRRYEEFMSRTKDPSPPPPKTREQLQDEAAVAAAARAD